MAIDRTQLIERIKEIGGLSNDERSSLLELLRTTPKYGLVWENKPEDVEAQMQDELPVFTEVKDRAIISEAPDAPNHILIEGDNLHALTALTYTHEGKIDVIYIDPPYNTGNKDFIYNDSYVDREDGYRHSKWLSFMAKRLRIAKRLLSEKGVIFISIDDNEVNQLTMLCNEIFGEPNKVALLPTVMNLKGNQAQFGFAGTHEYTLVFAKSISELTLNQLDLEEDEIDDWSEDEIGYYKKGATLKRTGNDAPREKRPFGYYPILVHNESLSVTTISKEEYSSIYNRESKTFDDEYVNQLKAKYNALGYTFILPVIENNGASWRWGYNTLLRNRNEVIVSGTYPNFSLYKKQRPELGNVPTRKPKSILYKAQYSSGNGTAQLKAILHEKLFDNPKPLDLIFDLLQIGTKGASIVLDFFAGSGTTGHALMQLNQSSKSNNTFILVTNNEGDICDNVTYQRLKKVINGYRDEDDVFIPGLTNNSLRYYRTDFVPRERTQKNMRQLVAAATDLLCIKNDLYTETGQLGGRKMRPSLARHFKDGDKEMLIIYDDQAIPYIAEMLKSVDVKTPILTYVFSPNNYPYTDEFYEVAEKVKLCALPAAIYDAYRKVLKKPKPRFIETENENVVASESEDSLGGMFDIDSEEGCQA